MAGWHEPSAHDNDDIVITTHRFYSPFLAAINAELKSRAASEHAPIFPYTTQPRPNWLARLLRWLAR